MNKIHKFLYKIKKIGFVGVIKQGWSELLRPFIPTVHKIRWNKCSKNNDFLGISLENRPEQLIVSLTTYPARIKFVHTVIESLLMQTTKPNRLILWLANEQFPNKEKDLPEELLGLKKFGLSIEWCEDLKSYKKLIPTLEKYPDAIVITTDDDMYYHPKMVQRLYEAYLKEPNYIHCHRVTKFYMSNGQFKTIPGGYDVYKHPSYLHKLTGCSGSCYPPHSLPADMTDKNLFMNLAKTNDDIWFWLMGVLAGLKCNIVKHNYPALYFIDGSQEEALNYINDQGEKLFWKQFFNIISYYPELKEILEKEWVRESNQQKNLEE